MSRSSLSRDALDLKVRNMMHLGKPSIDISLNAGHDARGGYVPSFSTMERIEGTVSVTAKTDTRFDDIEITFVGTTRTYVDKLTTATSGGRTEATHRFLKLTQPIDESTLPLPRIAEAGRTYRFPFTFVIPTHLLPSSCSHKVSNDQVRHAHLQLPPSLGDHDVSGRGGTLLDDLAPEMARVSYAIRVKLGKTRELDGAAILLAEKSRKVRVTPAFPEQPPLPSSADGDADYRLRQEKSIKKGMFGSRLGRLTMQAAQPAPFHLPASTGASPAEPVTGVAKIALRFDPAEKHSPPPRLGSLSAKLKATTFYASKARAGFPSKADVLTDASQGVIADTLPLSSRCVQSVQWTRCEAASAPASPSSPAPASPSSAATAAPVARRDSGVAIPAAAHEAAGPFYTATIVVPLALPSAGKTLVPTFHSCLVSRTYTLLLHLSLHAPGFGAAPSLSLKLPVQIAAEGAGAGAGMSGEEAEQVEREAQLEAESVFVPRSVAPPTAVEEGSGRWEGVRAARDPPVYEVFAPQTFGRVVWVS